MSKDIINDLIYVNPVSKETDSYNGTGLKGTDIYNRTNKVFGLSLNYKF
jgi:long-chain fatty acid transport protein